MRQKPERVQAVCYQVIWCKRMIAVCSCSEYDPGGVNDTSLVSGENRLQRWEGRRSRIHHRDKRCDSTRGPVWWLFKYSRAVDFLFRLLSEHLGTLVVGRDQRCSKRLHVTFQHFRWTGTLSIFSFYVCFLTRWIFADLLIFCFYYLLSHISAVSQSPNHSAQ